MPTFRRGISRESDLTLRKDSHCSLDKVTYPTVAASAIVDFLDLLPAFAKVPKITNLELTQALPNWFPPRSTVLP